MHISAINPSFSGRRDNVDAIVGMDDNDIRRAAYLKTSVRYDHDKSRKITNGLFYSAPLAAGLATAAFTKGKAKIFSKTVSGLAARAANGLKVAAIWTAALGAIDLLGFGKKKLAENSPQIRKFDKEHPLLSMGLMFGGAVAAVAGVNKAAIKLASVKAPKFLQNVAKNSDKFLNNNKVVQNIKGKAASAISKMPVALKDIAKTTLSWAPTMLLFGGLFHSIGSAGRENREFLRNYTELKEKQAEITKAKLVEAQMQNDY